VHVQSWQNAYRDVLPQDYLDGLTPARRLPLWERVIRETDRPRSGVIVAEAHGQIIGFVHVTPTRDSDGDPTAVGELTAIYVLPGWSGQGIGRQLMAAAVNLMTIAGFDQATLWVLHTNVRARHFYEAAKWRPDGTTRQEVIGGVPITEYRYQRPLP
jgi:ribosomal protein S18 acetylase RimI-like enzyme